MPDILFNLIYVCVMAIVNSLAIGKSVKSAGNLTYKTVRGRTIASQRIISNKSNTPSQSDQRYHFTKVSQSMALLQRYIDVCYEKSKYGSSRNAFFSRNKNFTLGGLIGEVLEGLEPLSRAMLSALSEKPVPQLSLITNGSLAGFISINYSVVNNYKYGEDIFDSLSVITDDAGTGYSTGMYNFVFSSLVRREALKIHFFGFSDKGLVVSTGIVDASDMGHISFDNPDLRLALAGTQATLAMSSSNQALVESVHIEVDMSKVQNCPIAIVVPSVSGKVPTIEGVFAKQSAV